MKKMIVVSFAFMFLLAIVAGCPQKPVDSKPADTSTAAGEFGGESDTIPMTSDDEAADDIYGVAVEPAP
jgi:hypothetical protein